jgi:hypothetical protein
MNSIKSKLGITKHFINGMSFSHTWIFFLATILLSTSCVKYSLSGGDTGSAKTITIRTFFNESGGGPPNLSQIFSEKLRDYYQQNSKLVGVADGGDWQLEGRIIGYTVSPIAPTGTETAGLNRLTITVGVTFLNNMEATGEVQDFQQSFSFYEDFPQTENITQAETRLIETVLNRIVFDIFSKTTSNW